MPMQYAWRFMEVAIGVVSRVKATMILSKVLRVLVHAAYTYR